MARQDVGRSKGTEAGNWKLLLMEHFSPLSGTSVLAGAKLESGHREHQSLILRDLLWSVLGAGLHTVVVFCQSFLQCKITTSISGH